MMVGTYIGLLVICLALLAILVVTIQERDYYRDVAAYWWNRWRKK